MLAAHSLKYSRRLLTIPQTLRPIATMSRHLANPALFICDIQDKFRNAIHEFPKVVSTSQKMIKAAKLLNIPIYITTQNSAKLGPTVQELTQLLPENVVETDKTAFSMMVPTVSEAVLRQSKPETGGPQAPLEVLIVGIETHICVTQTTLDLLSMGHKVYILQDGVSSCNAGERGVALRRLQSEGAVVTTSESVLFELMGDAGRSLFKEFTALIKEFKKETSLAVEVFCGGADGGGGSKL
jgi:nicotinamidase-related amidase